MGKFIIFGMLFYIFGNPFIAIIVLLLIVYVLDRRFVGVFPSITRPIQRARQISKLRKNIAASPSDVSSRHELARLLIERRKYGEALKLLESISESLQDSAEYWDDIGTARLKTGNTAQGEADILQALDINPRVKYGRPYLRLADAFRTADSAKALDYLQKFHTMHSSSSEALPPGNHVSGSGTASGSQGSLLGVDERIPIPSQVQAAPRTQVGGSELLAELILNVPEIHYKKLRSKFTPSKHNKARRRFASGPCHASMLYQRLVPKPMQLLGDNPVAFPVRMKPIHR